MKLMQLFALAFLVLTLSLTGGCLRPKRTTETGRSFVLSALSDPSPATNELNGQIALGIAPIEMPAYLLDTRIVIRKGEAEVRYFDNRRWAERLDKGVQRVLGANLATLLKSDRIALSAWQRRNVQAELSLSILQFDCDEHGQVTLDCRWQLLTPGGDSTLLTRHSRIVRQASATPRDLSQTVLELSLTLGELSKEMAAVIPQAVTATPKAQ